MSYTNGTLNLVFWLIEEADALRNQTPSHRIRKYEIGFHIEIKNASTPAQVVSCKLAIAISDGCSAMRRKLRSD